MTNTLAPLSELQLPELPAPYVWNIRPDQGDGEFQFYPAGTAFLITIDRPVPILGGIRATGAPGYYVPADAPNESLRATAQLIHDAWLRYRAQRERTAELERLRRTR